MKKLALLVFSALTFVSCSLDDDGPNTLFEPAEITQADLPEYFEEGENYEVDVTYLLPDACHTFHSFRSYREQTNDSEDREYIIVAFTFYDANLTECTEEDDDLSETKSLEFTIDGEVGTIYTFNFWVGENSLGEAEYYTVEVPVIDPDADDTDLEENEE